MQSSSAARSMVDAAISGLGAPAIESGEVA